MEPCGFELDGIVYEVRFERQGRGSRCRVFCQGEYTGQSMAMPGLSLERLLEMRTVMIAILKDIVANTRDEKF